MAWTPDDGPEGHPLWEEQLALELEMATYGMEKFKEASVRAVDRGDVLRIKPYRRLAEVLVEDMVVGLKAWLTGCARRRGPKPQAFEPLKSIDPYVACFITVRSVLAAHSTGTLGLTHLGAHIGLEVEHQAQMQEWVREEPKLYREVQRALIRNRSTLSHRERVNINRFNKLVKGKVGWVPWTADDRRHTGLKLVDILCRATARFEIVEDPTHIRTGVKRARYVVQADDEVVQYLMEAMGDSGMASVTYLPTLMPPKRWEGMRQGAYYSKAVRQPRLINFKAASEEQQGAAADEFDALDMPRVYAAVEAVQSVPWRINKRVLAVAWECWDREITVKGLGGLKPEPLPPRPIGLEGLRTPGGRRDKEAENKWIAEHEKEFKQWKRSASKVHGTNARRMAHVMAARSTLQLADRFRDREFYFPHRLDFRGRMYPIPAYLQPQGGDLARGLLTFARGRPIGESGGNWLAINVANNWGMDKVSYSDRIAWVLERIDLLTAIADHPMRHLEWTQSKTPWQLLAAIFEFVRAVREGNSMLSALPIRVDGTCNGIQHLSAMMRDEAGGASVNLMPSDYPRDIYMEVALELQNTLEAIETSGGAAGAMAHIWLKGLHPEIPREFTKRQVMVMPYGGTREAYLKYTRQYVEEDHPDTIPLDTILPDAFRFSKREDPTTGMRKEVSPSTACVSWIVPHLWAAVEHHVGAGMECMRWLQECAKALVDTNQPIVWKTPTGFYVRHFYGKLEERMIRTLVDGRSMGLAYYERSKDLSSKEQLQGIAPNFVHSMDGSANMETAIRFAVETHGAPFTTIHDSFGTVAGEMDLLHQTLRYSFVWVHKVDVLEAFRQQCVNILRDHILATNMGTSFEDAWQMADDIIPKVPARGSLDISEVLNADYFFA